MSPIHGTASEPRENSDKTKFERVFASAQEWTIPNQLFATLTRATLFSILRLACNTTAKVGESPLSFVSSISFVSPSSVSGRSKCLNKSIPIKSSLRQTDCRARLICGSFRSKKNNEKETTLNKNRPRIGLVNNSEKGAFSQCQQINKAGFWQQYH